MGKVGDGDGDKMGWVMGRRGAGGDVGIQGREIWEASLPSGSMTAWSWPTGVPTAPSSVWRGRRLGEGVGREGEREGPV